MAKDTLKRLTQMMTALRNPDTGCPWDKKQTYKSLTPHTLEETHEVIDAIESENYEHLKDELGDLLFQVVFYAQIASEEKRFDLIDVIENLIDKMHRRHPHVFADKQFKTQAELTLHWDKIKALEKQSTNVESSDNSVLDNVPLSMPALSRAQKMQKRAAKTGFEWKTIDQVNAKVEEEIAELHQAIESDNHTEIEHEIGDLFLATVNLARHLNVDSEQALRLANQRFKNRFQHLESHFEKNDKAIADSDLDELLQIWETAKISLNDR